MMEIHIATRSAQDLRQKEARERQLNQHTFIHRLLSDNITNDQYMLSISLLVLPPARCLQL